MQKVELKPSGKPVQLRFSDIELKGIDQLQCKRKVLSPKIRYKLELRFGASEPGTILIDDVLLESDFDDATLTYTP